MFIVNHNHGIVACQPNSLQVAVAERHGPANLKETDARNVFRIPSNVRLGVYKAVQIKNRVIVDAVNAVLQDAVALAVDARRLKIQGDGPSDWKPIHSGVMAKRAMGTVMS